MQKKIIACLFVCLSLSLCATHEAKGDCDTETTKRIELKKDDPINPIKINAPITLNEGITLTLEITGRITATIELSGPTEITLTSKNVPCLKKEYTSSLKCPKDPKEKIIIYLKPGNYTIKETYSFTLKSLYFPDTDIPQKAEFKWNYKANKEGNYQFSLDGRIRNMTATIEGDDISQVKPINIPEPNDRETIEVITQRPLISGEEIKFTATYSADWIRTACIEPIIHELFTTIKAPDFVSAPYGDFAGQEFSLRMVVENRGTVMETEVIPSLEISVGGGEVVKVSGPSPEKSDTPPGESQTYEWVYSAKNKGTVTFKGKAKSKEGYESNGASKTVTIQTPPILTCKFEPPEIKMRETQSATLTMIVTNKGEVTATGVTPELPIPLALKDKSELIPKFSLTKEKQTIEGGKEQKYEWLFTANSRKEPYQFEGSISGIDFNSGKPTPTSEKCILSAEIFLPPPRNPLSVQITISSDKIKDQEEIIVSAGQKITVNMKVTNNDTQVEAQNVKPLELGFSPVGKVTLLSGPKPTQQNIPPGDSRIYAWEYETEEVSAETVVIFKGSASGTNILGETIQSDQAESQLTIQRPAILIGEIKVSTDDYSGRRLDNVTQISEEQRLYVTLVVKNDGDAKVVEVTPSLDVSPEGKVAIIDKPPPEKIEISKDEPKEFKWTYNTFLGSAWEIIFTGKAEGKDANSGKEISIKKPPQKTVLIQKSPYLQAKLRVKPNIVTKGQEVEVNLEVTNSGEAEAINVTTTLEVTPEGGKPKEEPGFKPDSATIFLNETKIFTLKYDTSKIEAGKIKLKAMGRGKDANSGEEITFTSNEVEVEIQLEPKLTAKLEELPKQVTAGDPITIKLTVTNNGQAKTAQAKAKDVAPELILGGVGDEKFLSSPRPLTEDIAGNGGSQTYEWTYFTQKGDANKTITFSGKAKGKDANSGKEVKSEQTDTREISIKPPLTPPKLVCKIKASPKVISEGQSITADITVKNEGGMKASKVIIKPEVQKILPEPWLKKRPFQTKGIIPEEQDISAGVSVTYTLFDPTGTEDKGLYIVSVQCSCEEDSEDEDSDYVLVQRPAKIETKQIEAPEEVSVSENITITVTITNTGEVDAISVVPPKELVVTGTGRAKFVSGPPTTEAILHTYEDRIYSWTYNAIQEGGIEFSGTITGKDKNSGNPITPISFAKSVEIKSVEGLMARIESMQQISEGQDISVTMHVTNNTPLTEYAVAPSLKPTETGTVKPVSGPTPSEATISPKETKEYKWTYSTSERSAGTIRFIGNVKSASGTTLKGDAISNLITIQRPPNLSCKLEIPSQTYKGEKIKIKQTITNGGKATAMDVKPILEIGGIGDRNFLSPHEPSLANITGGLSNEFSWEYDTTQGELGPIPFTGSATGRDGNSEEEIPKQNIGTDSKTVEVKTPLVIFEFTAKPEQISEGQTIAVTMKVKNEREAIIRAVQPSELKIQGSGKATMKSGPEPPKTDILGGETKEFNWTYPTSGGSEGKIQFVGSASGEGGISSSEEKTNEVMIQRPAKLEAEMSVEPPDDIIENLSITVIMQVKNIGESTAIGVKPTKEPLDISIVSGSEPIPDLSTIEFVSAPSPQDIPGGGSKKFIWHYFLHKRSAGTVEFKGDVIGKDENSKKDVTATGSLPIKIGRQPELQIIDLKFLVKKDEKDLQVEKISEGQDFKVVMLVRNNGEVAAVDVAPKLLLKAGGRENNIQKLSGPSPAVKSIEPGATQEKPPEYSWEYMTTTGAAGLATFTASVEGKDLHSNELTRNLLIQRPAFLKAELLLSWNGRQVGQISRGQQDITITMNITNDGEATAVDVNPKLILGEVGLQKFLSAIETDKKEVPGGKSELVEFTWTYKTDETTPTGKVVFSGEALGYDENSLEMVTAGAESKEVIIQKPPNLTFEIEVPQDTFCVEQNAPVTIRVTNEGEAMAESVIPELKLFGEDVLDPSLGPIPSVSDIAGGKKQPYNWTYPTSKPGDLIFIGRIKSGKDSNSQKDIFPTDELQTTVKVVPAAKLTLSSLTLSKDKVTKGQPITITLKVENTGIAKALNVTPKLYIKDVEYTRAPKPEKADIASDGSQEYKWEYDTKDNEPGDITFKGTATGTSEHCNWPIEPKEPLYKTVLIQLPPNLIATLDASPQQVSEGQEIKVIMSVINKSAPHETREIATAIEVKAPEKLTITGTGKVSLVSFEENPPPKEEKISIPADKTQQYIWTYIADSAGNVKFSGKVNAKDENTNENVFSNEAESREVLIQTSPNIKAVLNVEKVEKEEEERIGIRQKFNVVVELTNSGQAAAEIKPATDDLTLSLPSLLGKKITLPITKISPTTVTIKGGGKEEIRYSSEPLENINVLIETLKGKPEGEKGQLTLEKLSIIDQNNPEQKEKKYLQPVEPASVHIDLERPKLEKVLYRDANDQTNTLPIIDEGDQLILKFNEPIKMKAGVTDEDFVLLPEGSSLGKEPIIPLETKGSTEITITLGSRPNLKVEGKTGVSFRIAIRAIDLIVDLAGNEFFEEGEIVTEEKAEEATFECDDRKPPEITNIRPNYGEGVNDQPIIRIWATDEEIKGCETGIDRDSIQFTLRAEDGQEFSFGLNEVHIKREEVVIVELKRVMIAHQFFEFALRASANPPIDKITPLPEGKYELEVLLSDKRGNKTPEPQKASFQVVVDAIVDLVNYPNPFPVGKETRIRYILSKPASSITINIYDMAGRLVYAIGNANGSVGLHTDVTWNGKASSDEKLTAGIYICELVATMEGNEYRKYSKIAIRPPKKGEKP
jgi:hypothetical protein